MSNTMNDSMTVGWAHRLADTLDTVVTLGGKTIHLQCASCDAEFNKADNEHIRYAYVGGDYKRKDGKFECDDCRPRYYHPKAFFVCPSLRDGLIESLVEFFEEMGNFTIEESGGTITTITKENVDSFEVFYDCDHRRWRGWDNADIFRSLTPKLRVELWEFVLYDLTKLSETHHVPDKDIAKVKAKIAKAKSSD